MKILIEAIVNDDEITDPEVVKIVEKARRSLHTALATYYGSEDVRAVAAKIEDA